MALAETFHEEPEDSPKMGWLYDVDAASMNLLVEQAQQSETPEARNQAFGQVVVLTQHHVENLARRIVRSPEDAKDVTQQAFLKAWRGISRFRGEASFSTWLYRVVDNAAKSHLGRMKRQSYQTLTYVSIEEDEIVESERSIMGTEPSSEETWEKQESQRISDNVRNVLASLPIRQQTAVVLYDIHELSHKEVAEKMGVTHNTAKILVHRGRKALRETIPPNAE